MATLGLLQTMLFLNNSYDVTVFAYGVANNVLSGDSNYIVDVVMRPKFGNSSVSRRKVTITSFSYGLTRKATYIEGSS